MGRKVCAVFLVALLFFTQCQALVGQVTLRQDDSTSTTQPQLYRPFTYYYELRRGSTEMASIVLLVPEYVTSPRSPVPGVLPLQLELRSADGIRVKDFKYPRARNRAFAFTPNVVPVVVPVDEAVGFQLQAEKTAPLGRHLLTGKLTFQLISEAGPRPPQEIEVQFPVTVVEHHARVQKTEWAEIQVTGRDRTGMIVLAPVIVLYIIACIPGSILGCCRGS